MNRFSRTPRGRGRVLSQSNLPLLSEATGSSNAIGATWPIPQVCYPGCVVPLVVLVALGLSQLCLVSLLIFCCH